MNELLITLKDILAGGKVSWPSKKEGLVGVAQPGESPSGRGRSGSSSLGHRPKRPAPAKPPTGGGATRSRTQKEKEQSLVIGNLGAHSQEDPEIERDLVAKSTSLSQDASTSAYVDSGEKKREKSSKSHKQPLKRDLSSSTEPLLESSPSLSAEDDNKMDILPVPIVPPPAEVTSATEQKMRKHRKSGEFKNEGETKQKSKAKRKRKTEHDMTENRASKSEEVAPQPASLVAFKMSEPSAEEGELPLPQEIAEAAAINEAVIAGVGVGDGDQEKEDFILEPPLKFSQSSVDYLDEFGDVDQDSGPLSFDFAPPTAPSDDELEEDKPHPPIGHEKQAQFHHKTPQQISEKKKSVGGRLEAKKGGSATKPQESKVNREMEDEWQGLDYPVKNPPSWRGIGSSSRLPQGRGTARQTRPVYPRDQESEFDEFAHRDALEEEPDSDGGGGVMLDEDVAALLW